MKRFLLIALIATPLAAQGPMMPPHEAAPPETISVSGTGHATVAPDRFSFTAGVQTTAPTVEEAVNQNNMKMT
ncbi:MAG TPA: SIMPL domain-containing protein, partial [Thermoanaerobaculia bacterium]|nr:SIMPL domain-containing protein [Thermoanaerobaculia bacterium]